MPKIIVASKNPVKMRAALAGFQKMFPREQFEVEGVSVPSGVKDQPTRDGETLQGAVARAEGASRTLPAADFWVGIEGGIEESNGEMEAFAWVVIKSAGGILGKGKTGTLFLPQKVAELIRQGKELGEADDIVFGRTNSKQENGAVGILTGNAIDRTKLYADAMTLALIPFKNPELY